MANSNVFNTFRLLKFIALYALSLLPIACLLNKYPPHQSVSNFKAGAYIAMIGQFGVGTLFSIE